MRKQRDKIIGTPDYIAPEVIRGDEDHTPAVDWWSFGVIAYEILTGYLPFSGDDPPQIFDNIINNRINWVLQLNHRAKVNEEVELSEEATDLIAQLLRNNPQERLGHEDAEEIKAHPFFRKINWHTLRVSEPPFVPSVANATDTRYFAETTRKQFSLRDIGSPVSVPC